MNAVDTNVLVRWLAGDDPVQSQLAQQILSAPVFVSHTVLTELGWVLEKALGWPRNLVAEAFDDILHLETVSIVDQGAIGWAVERYRLGADFADMMHLVDSSVANSFITFDRKLANQAGHQSPILVEVVGRA